MMTYSVTVPSKINSLQVLNMVRYQGLSKQTKTANFRMEIYHLATL
jgi:hypothetical protein